MSRECIHVHGPHIFGSRALKLSLYFIGRAYKSKASASQILEALYTANARLCDVRNTGYLPIYRHISDLSARSYRTSIPRVYLNGTKSCLLALRIIISRTVYLEGNYVFLSCSRFTNLAVDR